eukprot:TRINITY_DN10420_c1_g1_i1.p1 TRINITY_DN10420_c1_g1~~TRINITY_DN10420_c1_g1_i1.p1  ORF type:complete len:236 (+),score=52.00 TRINITY_DN10420_c1_g1_i1:116-823(+)
MSRLPLCTQDVHQSILGLRRFGLVYREVLHDLYGPRNLCTQFSHYAVAAAADLAACRRCGRQSNALTRHTLLARARGVKHQRDRQRRIVNHGETLPSDDGAVVQAVRPSGRREPLAPFRAALLLLLLLQSDALRKPSAELPQAARLLPALLLLGGRRRRARVRRAPLPQLQLCPIVLLLLLLLPQDARDREVAAAPVALQHIPERVAGGVQQHHADRDGRAAAPRAPPVVTNCTS